MAIPVDWFGTRELLTKSEERGTSHLIWIIQFQPIPQSVPQIMPTTFVLPTGRYFAPQRLSGASLLGIAGRSRCRASFDCVPRGTSPKSGLPTHRFPSSSVYSVARSACSIPPPDILIQAVQSHSLGVGPSGRFTWLREFVPESLHSALRHPPNTCPLAWIGTAMDTLTGTPGSSAVNSFNSQASV
ncbi:hypothetical protein NMY22_g14609 [Coprinellus aureogranulatus]|nr:hypothetical protein NMY22_g14609 [Coprinellus aureogranulatus]